MPTISDTLTPEQSLQMLLLKVVLDRWEAGEATSISDVAHDLYDEVIPRSTAASRIHAARDAKAEKGVATFGGTRSNDWKTGIGDVDQTIESAVYYIGRNVTGIQNQLKWLLPDANDKRFPEWYRSWLLEVRDLMFNVVALTNGAYSSNKTMRWIKEVAADKVSGQGPKGGRP